MFQPIYTDEAQIAHYPEDVQTLIRGIQAKLDERWRFIMEQYSHSETLDSGAVVHLSKDGAYMQEQVGYFFNLSYAAWLCLPRLALQEMPLDWQARFVALMEEGYERGLTGPSNVSVVRKKGGKFVNNDHWNNYRRGTVRHAKARDVELGIEDWSDDV
ncbi:hypothetical protein KABACHOK_03080 [Brevundimonas phage vB_BpoS-Kabachok]|uniref:Uncharacterized protein n=1 Tax=Brevundimonas phage vB_BpoS-Kabachok TaxID=2948600 RepID=A0A9E7MPS2_9CAUD|nr:hypothetical protein KABACHOK_03080 [Brevundimonas phage vB_BpoS-Kabachok]